MSRSAVSLSLLERYFEGSKRLGKMLLDELISPEAVELTLLIQDRNLYTKSEKANHSREWDAKPRASGYEYGRKRIRRILK